MRSLTNDMAQLRSHIDDSRATRLSEHHVRITNVKSQLSDIAISRFSNGIKEASDDRAGAHAVFFGKSQAKKKQHF